MLKILILRSGITVHVLVHFHSRSLDSLRALVLEVDKRVEAVAASVFQVMTERVHNDNFFYYFR